ncbi:hypothetical protein B0H34DRAFT_504733 [Crassisporium funariophilum]|nr:hypothetical protein B0H34DRAFT_504733 [Crassisporium funariophilum]
MYSRQCLSLFYKLCSECVNSSFSLTSPTWELRLSAAARLEGTCERLCHPIKAQHHQSEHANYGPTEVGSSPRYLEFDQRLRFVSSYKKLMVSTLRVSRAMDQLNDARRSTRPNHAYHRAHMRRRHNPQAGAHPSTPAPNATISDLPRRQTRCCSHGRFCSLLLFRNEAGL